MICFDFLKIAPAESSINRAVGSEPHLAPKPTARHKFGSRAPVELILSSRRFARIVTLAEIEAELPRARALAGPVRRLAEAKRLRSERIRAALKAKQGAP